jgi:hypothetical protein
MSVGFKFENDFIGRQSVLIFELSRIDGEVKEWTWTDNTGYHINNTGKFKTL